MVDVDIKIEACGVCGSDVHTISGTKYLITRKTTKTHGIMQVDGEIKSSRFASDMVSISQASQTTTVEYES